MNIFYIKKIILSFILLILFFSCDNNKIIIKASKDAFVTSIFPDKNFSGKNEGVKNNGYGAVKRTGDNYFTYPALYLSNSEDEKDSFLLGGFNFNNIKAPVKHASLKFFINYATASRKRITLIIKPVLTAWEEDKITFNDIYFIENDELKRNKKFITDENRVKIIVFDINFNDYILPEIPFQSAKKTVSVNVTDVINYYITNQETFDGFLIEPMDMNDPRYITSLSSKIISDTGSLEIAPSEWYDWDGIVPDNFYFKNGSFLKVKNRAYKNKKYAPGLEITL